VPEASVIRRVQALSGFIGRKEFRRRFVKFLVKAQSSTLDKPKKLTKWRVSEGDGTLSVGVKSVDIKWNTKGEGDHLGYF